MSFNFMQEKHVWSEVMRGKNNFRYIPCVFGRANVPLLSISM